MELLKEIGIEGAPKKKIRPPSSRNLRQFKTQKLRDSEIDDSPKRANGGILLKSKHSESKFLESSGSEGHKLKIPDSINTSKSGLNKSNITRFNSRKDLNNIVGQNYQNDSIKKFKAII